MLLNPGQLHCRLVAFEHKSKEQSETITEEGTVGEKQKQNPEQKGYEASVELLCCNVTHIFTFTGT